MKFNCFLLATILTSLISYGQESNAQKQRYMIGVVNIPPINEQVELYADDHLIFKGTTDTLDNYKKSIFELDYCPKLVRIKINRKWYSYTPDCYCPVLIITKGPKGKYILYDDELLIEL